MEATVVFQKNWDAMHALNPDGTRKYRYIVNEGSSRSSKTFSMIDCYDLYARACRNKRLTVWRDTKKVCKDTILKDTEKHLKATDRYGVGHVFNKTESVFAYATGSTFEIHGTDDHENVHGLSQDVAWFNEPYKIGKETFDQIDQRTSDFIFIDWNPTKSHWIDNLKKDPRTIVIHSTFKDNPFCPIEQKRKILSYQPVSMASLVERDPKEAKAKGLLTEQEARAYDLIANPKGYSQQQIKELQCCRENEDKATANEFNWSVYGLGLKAERPNRIFKWTEISYEEYKKLDSKIYNGVDWGSVDPWGILEAKYYDGGLYLHELNYASENTIRDKLTTTERVQIAEAQEGIVTWLFGKLGISQQNTIVCDTNRPLKIAVLRRAGWSQAIPASKPADSIKEGIDLLNNIKVYYTACSENLKYEQENYSRKMDKYGVVLEEPEDIDNHLMDPARYVAQYLQAKGIIKLV